MSQYTNSSGDIDPFEARLHFNSILKKITSSQQTIQTCTTFALRHHNLCVKSKKVEFNKYIEYIQRDLKKIVVDYVCERDDGCFNLVNTLKILSNWKEKSYFDISVIESTERVLLDWKKEPNYPAKLKLSKHDILKRIEEDRERAKHLREDIWWVDKSIPDGEALSLWEECSDLDKNDYLEILTENFKYQPDYPWLDVYKKVKLWNEEQKQLEEEELKARLEEERARQKLEEEERARQKFEEEKRERQKLEEEERARQKLEEEERARQKFEEEERVRQKLEEEERARQKLEEEERERQRLEEELKAQQKIEEEREQQLLEEEERELQKLEEEERARQKIEEEEQARQKIEEEERERQRLEEELKAQQKIEEEREQQLLEEERTRQELEELKEMQQRVEREELKEQQQLVEEDDHSFRSIGTKRQHCLDDILNDDVHEIKRLSKKARTQDYHNDNHLVISADNCGDENSFNINENIGYFSKSQGIDGTG
ncbi:63_t:CDS:2, partial [Dentiscutata heterogama]